MDKLDLLKNLVIMSAADGSFSAEEIALLVDRAASMGLNEEDLEKSISFALSNQAALVLPTDPAEQEGVLEDLIRMMAADGNLSEPEKRLFALTTAKMGFPCERLDALIDRLVRSVTPEEDAAS